MKENFYLKIIEIQTELVAPKNLTNTFGGYKYRSCEGILEAVKPLMRDKGLFLTMSDKIIQVGEKNYVEATATISDGENSLVVSAYAREADVKKGMDDVQITGACSSYARKYALNGLFCIDDVKDADATNTHDKTPVSATATPHTPSVSPSRVICPVCGKTTSPKALEAFGKCPTCKQAERKGA